MLKKGKYSWYSPALFLGESARGILNRMPNLRDIPHIPAFVMEIQTLLQDENLQPKQLKVALRQEPVIAAQVLSLAEALRMSRNPSNPPIKTLEHAVVYIGFKMLGEIVMTSALRTLDFSSTGFDVDQYWNESLACGGLAEAFSSACKTGLNADEVYIAATLCNSGKLLQAFALPGQVKQLCLEIESPNTLSTWLKAEAARSLPDHRILGEIAGIFWGFPEYVITAIQNHHHVPDVNTRSWKIWEISAVANQLSHWMLLRPHRIENSILEAAQKKSGLDEEGITSIVSSVQRALRLQ